MPAHKHAMRASHRLRVAPRSHRRHRRALLQYQSRLAAGPQRVQYRCRGLDRQAEVTKAARPAAGWRCGGRLAAGAAAAGVGWRRRLQFEAEGAGVQAWKRERAKEWRQAHARRRQSKGHRPSCRRVHPPVASSTRPWSSARLSSCRPSTRFSHSIESKPNCTAAPAAQRGGCSRGLGGWSGAGALSSRAAAGLWSSGAWTGTSHRISVAA